MCCLVAMTPVCSVAVVSQVRRNPCCFCLVLQVNRPQLFSHTLFKRPNPPTLKGLAPPLSIFLYRYRGWLMGLGPCVLRKCLWTQWPPVCLVLSAEHQSAVGRAGVEDNELSCENHMREKERGSRKKKIGWDMFVCVSQIPIEKDGEKEERKKRREAYWWSDKWRGYIMPDHWCLITWGLQAKWVKMFDLGLFLLRGSFS